MSTNNFIHMSEGEGNSNASYKDDQVFRTNFMIAEPERRNSSSNNKMDGHTSKRNLMKSGVQKYTSSSSFA